MTVLFELDGERFPLAPDDAAWLANEMRRLDIDGEIVPGSMHAGAVLIENALEDASQPICLTPREAVQVERLLDFAPGTGRDKYAGRDFAARSRTTSTPTKPPHLAPKACYALPLIATDSEALFPRGFAGD
jgi:hypothetical protein